MGYAMKLKIQVKVTNFHSFFARWVENVQVLDFLETLPLNGPHLGN